MGIDEGYISGGLTHPARPGRKLRFRAARPRVGMGVKEPPRSITLKDQMKSKIVRSEDSMRKAGSHSRCPQPVTLRKQQVNTRKGATMPTRTLTPRRTVSGATRSHDSATALMDDTRWACVVL